MEMESGTPDDLSFIQSHERNNFEDWDDVVNL